MTSVFKVKADGHCSASTRPLHKQMWSTCKKFVYNRVSMFVNLCVWNFELLWSPVLVPEFQIFTAGSAESDFNDWQVSFPPLSCYCAVQSRLSQGLPACELDRSHGLSFKHLIYFILPESVVLYWTLSFITLCLFRPFYIFIIGIP